jgi:long-chain fatty acid transport protein
MYKKNRLAVALVLSLSAVIPRYAIASNGYFDYGHGTKNKGMAGAGIALPQDAMAAATNPAGMVFVGERVDFGLEATNQKVAYEYDVGGLYYHSTNEKKTVVHPHLGYNGMLDPLSSIGVTNYVNARMDLSYPGIGDFEMRQYMTNLSYAHRFGKYTSLGGSFIGAVQDFSTNVEATAFLSPTGNSTVFNGPRGTSSGYGFKVGFQTGGKNLTLAGSYQTKIIMGDPVIINTGGGLSITGNSIDIPPTYTLGTALRVGKFAAVLDIQRINYSSVSALSSPGSLSSDAGYGWKNVTVLKLGTQYTMGGTTLRLGVSHAKPPIDTTDMSNSLYLPLIIENHASLGITQVLNEDIELSMAYTHGLKNTVSGVDVLEGTSATVPVAAGYPLDIESYQNSLEISLAVKF